MVLGLSTLALLPADVLGCGKLKEEVYMFGYVVYIYCLIVMLGALSLYGVVASLIDFAKIIAILT